MGTYHQGGIVPTQLAIPNIITSLQTTISPPPSDLPFPKEIPGNLNHNHSDTYIRGIDNATVYWWKTYPPPQYLLGRGPHNPGTDLSINLTTTTLMGLPLSELKSTLSSSLLECSPPTSPNKKTPLQTTFLVFPLSALPYLSPMSRTPMTFTAPTSSPEGGKLTFHPLYLYRTHLNLDDIDIPEDGVFGTIKRVIGMRGLGVWRVTRSCDERDDEDMGIGGMEQMGRGGGTEVLM